MNVTMNALRNSPSDQELIAFVLHEARLIDQHRFEEWLELFADDGYYWMPLEWGQTDPRLTTSLMYEDKLLLRIRIERLKGNRTFSQKPKSRCHHVLQTPQIDRRDEAANEYVTWTPMHYVETRLDDQDLYAAWATHTLAMVGGKLKIRFGVREFAAHGQHGAPMNTQPSGLRDILEADVEDIEG